jgi:tight adherence protein B
MMGGAMDGLILLIYVTIFLFSASVVEVIFLVWNETRFGEKRQVKRRLMNISAGGQHGRKTLALYKRKVMEKAGALERLIFSLPRIAVLDRMLVRTRLPVSATTFVLFSLALGGVGFWLALWLLHQLPLALVVGGILLFLPWLALQVAEQQVLRRFDEQLPEALDLLARALRSGNALAAGLAMVSEEMPDPVRGEFAETVDEINLGLSMREALENLCHRVPTRDCRMFTLAVIIQKDTGGNIAEILDNISRLVRERMQFRRQVQALTAEGRLSAWILILLPVVMFFYIFWVNHDYAALLWKEEIGRMMLGGALLLQFLGVLVIRRIVRIDL